jgi:hypothetical protein
MCYAYFGQTGATNSYNVDNCPSLGISQHYTNMNPNSFQIISAGRDKIFGDPSQWSPNNGTTNIPGRDDMSNFSQSALADGV